MKRARLFAGLAVLIVLAVLAYLWWSPPDPSAPQTARLAPEGGQAEAETAAAPKSGAQSEPAQAPSSDLDQDQVARVPPADSATPSVRPRAVVPPQDGGPAAMPPSFDVVRVEPNGEAVIAGRATPGSTVHLLDGGEHLAETRADGNGEWVIVLRTPLAPGSHELGLESHLSTGETLLSENVVVVSVPAPAVVAAAPGAPAETAAETPVAAPGAVEPAAPAASEGEPGRDRIGEAVRPLAVLMPRTGVGPSRILQTPEPVPRGLGAEVLVLQTVDYDSQGRAVIGGRGRAGVVLLVYLDGRLVGRTVVGPDGRWQVLLEAEIPYGVHALRVDQLDAVGQVVARVESPFSRARLLASMTDETAVIVQPGNSLWRIARRVYGKGVRYAVIYEANRGQIRDPDLIYPGQVFVVPTAN